ncbi:ACT domain-containing protein [Cognatishimia sp. WU-CL00825]|uniref:ACT domain-containing protein n=1 Tax=Cognatishimia sp. WU-CL00825 TaxID=3127658 RepID=UPI003102F059
MSGETNLDALINSMSAVLVDGVFVFVTLKGREIPKGIVPQMVFQEVEGTTLIMQRSEALALGQPYEFPCRMITLNIHSSLEAVGFMARIATALAKSEMGVNPVSGFFHDHLFVPDGREAEALQVLRSMAQAE